MSQPMSPPMKAATLFVALVASSTLQAAELHVVSSDGFAAAYKTLSAEWQKQTGNSLVTERGLSLGEKVDVVILVASALDQLVEQGTVARENAVQLARSGIGIVVKEGAPIPDISTAENLKQTLVAAQSIAYPDSASGIYVEREMFKKMGIEDQVRNKSRMIPAEPVGEVVARGEAEIGFQQVSELRPIKGVTIVGPVPELLQRNTVFSAGILASSQEQDAARSLVQFLASPAAATTILNSGMEPAGPPK